MSSDDETTDYDIIDLEQQTTDNIEEIYNATSTGKTADLSTLSTPPTAWYRMGD